MAAISSPIFKCSLNFPIKFRLIFPFEMLSTLEEVMYIVLLPQQTTADKY